MRYFTVVGVLAVHVSVESSQNFASKLKALRSFAVRLTSGEENMIRIGLSYPIL